MPTFSRFDVVAAPFPYVERPITRRRPCVVMATLPESGLVWVLMITSAQNASWPGDEVIADVGMAGLRVPSVVRTSKIATVEANVLRPVGRLDPDTTARVRSCLAELLDLA